MTRTTAAAVAIALLTIIALPAFAGPAPSDVDLKATDGPSKLFDTIRDNSGGE